MDKNENIVIPEWLIRVTVLAAIAFVIAGYFHGLFTPVSVTPQPSVGLVMTSVQAKLTRQAIDLVRKDVEQGNFQTASLAIQALSALLPSDVRDKVLLALGVHDLEFMRDALDILEGSIIVKD